MRRITCKHCGNPRGCGSARGLCRLCYDDKAIRNKYPAQYVRPSQDVETEAELDQIIAEQRRNLPEWWDSETLCASEK